MRSIARMLRSLHIPALLHPIRAARRRRLIRVRLGLA